VFSVRCELIRYMDVMYINFILQDLTLTETETCYSFALIIQENISLCNIHCLAYAFCLLVTAYPSKCFHGYYVQFPCREAHWSLSPHDNLQHCPFEALRAVIPLTVVQSVMHFRTLHAGKLILTEIRNSTANNTIYEAKILLQRIKT
jgi:hypothetical protein